MFTGIIEAIGVVEALRPSGTGRIITVSSPLPLDGTRIGDSIAVNGACLTVTTLQGRRFTADISPETVEKTTFSTAKTGDRVNLERALRLSDRLDGHLVSGHVDGIGRVADRRSRDNAILLSFEIDTSLSRYVIPKGSIAIDGVSLTVNSCSSGRFDVCIIPHTSALTTITRRGIGDPVNIETDMIGKYVASFAARVHETEPAHSETHIDRSFLSKHGFI